jgi:exosortase
MNRYGNAVYILALTASLPIFVEYATTVWTRGHYQFLPIMIAVAVWLMYCRLLDNPARPNSETRLGSIFAGLTLGASAVGLVFANVLQSSQLVIPCIMLLSASYIADRKGLSGFRKAFPAWVLLAFAIPLPFNSDQTLIQTMQFTASQLASWILDSLGQVHFRQGVTLVTETKQFFAEEACSGVRSLFSSLAAITVFGVSKNYPLWRHVFNLVQTFVWVVAGNAIRIAVVVFVSDNWTEAIATGGTHELLGLGVFAFIFMIALSVDRVIQLFMPTPAMHEDYELSNVIDAKIASSAGHQQPSPFKYAWIVLFGLILIFSARISYSLHELDGRIHSGKKVMNRITSGDLPAEINGWSVVDFEHKIRTEASLYAPESLIWTLSKENRSLIVSFDGSYPEFHDLTLCYRGLGWSVGSEHDYKNANVGSDAESLSTLDLKKANQRGIVYFSAFGINGHLVPPPQYRSRLDTAKRSLKMAVGQFDVVEESNRLGIRPISQVQIFESRQSKSAISENDLKEAKALFGRIRELLLVKLKNPD